MHSRPANLNLSDDPSGTRPPKMTYHLDLPSPRSGEVPPALSPLDAFALHSRILAKQFEEEAQNGRRISRLPHLAVAKELASRPDYFRSASGGSESGFSTTGELLDAQEDSSPISRGGLTVFGGEHTRPVSHYPMLGNMGKRVGGGPAATPFNDAEGSPFERDTQGYFDVDAPREASPEPVDHKLVNVEAPTPLVPSLTNSYDSVASSQPRTLTSNSTHSQRSLQSERGLLLPNSPGYSMAPGSMQNVRSPRQDSGDEDGSSHSGAYAASSRKFSGSTNMSRPQSPFSPFIAPMQRSPSMSSQYSTTGSQAPLRSRKAQYNFSRPRSSGAQSIPPTGTRPSFERGPSNDSSTELRSRHPSETSNVTYQSSNHTRPSSRQSSGDDAVTPANVYFDTPRLDPAGAADSDYFPATTAPNPTQSYTYTKYELPRGKSVERNSAGDRNSWIQKQFTWDKRRTPPPRSQDTIPVATDIEVFHQRDTRVSGPLAPVRTTSPTGSVGSERISGMALSRRDHPVRNRPNRSHSTTPQSRTVKTAVHRPSPSVTTESTEHTLRAVPLHQRAPSAEMTPEEHLELGIQTHTSGELTKSTYHLRLAARAGLPTAMLLYALACRHGWGMRPSPEEGVMWLRKAIDNSGLDVGSVDEPIELISSSITDVAEQRKRKAQFALAVYELGISYMNGWGCTKDKPLAVRCFEVAGSWGDCDALAEAAFSYTQGVGCKKDLKKAAGLYRKAADGGMSMTGNSWIYKAKYMDDFAASPASPKKSSPGKEKSSREVDNLEAKDSNQRPVRSRARSIWGRKKEKT